MEATSSHDMLRGLLSISSSTSMSTSELSGRDRENQDQSFVRAPFFKHLVSEKWEPRILNA